LIFVGDPGLGKSQLLQAAAAVSPRGIYVCGNATTKAGLTVAVVKDPMTSDYAFEAGIMFLNPFYDCTQSNSDLLAQCVFPELVGYFGHDWWEGLLLTIVFFLVMFYYLVLQAVLCSVF